MLSGIGVQRSEAPAQSKLPYPETTAAGMDSSLRSEQLPAIGLGLRQFLHCRWWTGIDPQSSAPVQIFALLLARLRPRWFAPPSLSRFSRKNSVPVF